MRAVSALAAVELLLPRVAAEVGSEAEAEAEVRSAVEHVASIPWLNPPAVGADGLAEFTHSSATKIQPAVGSVAIVRPM